MRVIAGKCRSLPLMAVPGSNTRPTTDRIKETLFNMIAPYIPGCNFLDLFSGSGAIGIEALSRGAKHACLVENDPQALKAIRKNIIFTRLENEADMIKGDVIKILETRIPDESFDVIFMDPPYNKGLEVEALKALKSSKWVKADTLYICEMSIEDDMTKKLPEGFDIIRYKKYKTNAHVFLKTQVPVIKET